MSAHITFSNLALAGWDISIKVVSAETTNEVVDIEDTALSAYFYTDLAMTELVGSVTPIQTPFLYNFTDSADYTIYCKILDSDDVEVTEDFTITDLRVRKTSCGTYQLYNPKPTGSISYTLSTLENEELSDGDIVGLSFTEITVEDGVYILNTGEKSIFLVNFCEVEDCVISIMQTLLTKDSTCCGDCETDLKEKERVNKILITYDLYKKIVDNSEKYVIRYNNLDINDKISEMFTAIDLAKQITDLCVSCTSTKSCGC